MDLEEMDEFKKNPTPSNARKLGTAITKTEGILEEKRHLYLQALDETVNEEIRAILNWWMIGSYLESPVHYTKKIMAVREYLNNPHITQELIEEWAWVIYEINRAPKDLLEFLAIDIRNIRGISRDLRVMLGHPSPDHPFRDA